MRKFTTYLIFTSIAFSAFASTGNEGDDKREEHLFHKELNFLGNLYQGTANPVRLSYNRVNTLTEASVDWNYRHGDFHKVDEAMRHSDFKVDISGLQHFGKLDLSGTIRYTNSTDYDHRWNSTLFLTPTNPFVLADSIPSDVSTEQFLLKAGSAYQFSSRIRGGLELEYLTGSAADQTDPRPKTNSMRFGVRPGVEFRPSAWHAFGLSGKVEIYGSDITHTVINNNINNVYFIMKGMGDHVIQTTSDMGSYPRDYKGTSYDVSVQWMMGLKASPAGRWCNLLQLTAGSNSEKATDGGSAYTFKGGDYSQHTYSVYDRFRWNASSRMQHNLSLRATYSTDEGSWYDQKKMTDTEHGNLTYYQILNKSKVRSSSYLQASAEYRVDWLDPSLLPCATVRAFASMDNADMKQYESASFHQTYTIGTFGAEGIKHWHIKKAQLKTGLTACYTAQLGDPKFATVKQPLTAPYTAPVFEWASASRYGFGIHAEGNFPVHIYNYSTWVGISAQVNQTYYNGKSDFTTLYDGTSRTTACVGIHITL